MKLLKYFGAFLVAALGLFLFVVNFSAVETRFQCSGEISPQNNSQQATIFMKLHEYRWWVGLWSDSDGSVWVEVPNRTVEYFERVIEVGDQLQIYDYQRNLKGYFSSLSKSLSIKTAAWSFDGTCKKVEK
ncbi:MAG: hypothetical protein Q7T38_08025 [Gallionella sp.]|nr:hypothetical protein [Gallionella sp.]